MLIEPVNWKSADLINECRLAHIARLDTLRAFAVSVVLVFHLKPEFLPWGYIGVDIFFSLSGFLMTILYLRAYGKGAEFTAPQFLVRRFWRIYPPLAITVLGTLIASFFIMAPSHLLASSWSAQAALLSVSNWLFFNEAGYFDSEAIVKPLLHTWSLGVEEQFYIFFALALYCATRIYLRNVLIVAVLASLAAWGFVILVEMVTVNNLLKIHNEPFSALFFLPQYRAFQFAAGGLAAYWLLKKHRSIEFAGLFLLVAAAFVAANPNAAHLAAPVVTVGTIMLMIHAPLLDGLAARNPINYLAKISYQLYLVHWPVIVIWQYVTHTPLTWFESGLCMVVCFALADGLYRLTNPMRRM